MNEQRIFADVDLPFHVWVREGQRWVLRETSAHRRAARHDGVDAATGIDAQDRASGAARAG